MDVSSEPPAHAPAPQISPQISPRDQQSYERSTGNDITVAQKNLQDASGKQWNAAQQDLVDKIRSFLTESLDASKDGDWARAQTLAHAFRKFFERGAHHIGFFLVEHDSQRRGLGRWRVRCRAWRR